MKVFKWKIAMAIFVALSNLILLPGANSVFAAQTSGDVETFSPDKAQADFDFMLRVLKEAHPGLNRYANESQLDREFAAQREKLKRPMTKSESYEVFAATLALIKCGHTSINPNEDLIKIFKTSRLFPLQIAVEDQRLIVKSNETLDDHTILPGMEILEINGNKAPELLQRFRRVESADGNIETSKWVHIQRGFGMYYWFLVEPTSEFRVRARNSAGLIVETKLAGVPRDQLGKSLNPVNDEVRDALAKLNWADQPLALRFLKQPEIAEIRIASFTTPNFESWIENTFRTLKEKGTKALIIDLRGNGGGPDMNGVMLVSCLMDHPFHYFERITAKTIDPTFKAQADWSEDRTRDLLKEVIPNPSGGYFVKHLGIGEQISGKYPFTGKVFILIDGGVFSTAADFCAVTHYLKRATFIGEETGGAYYGNNSGSFVYVTLPNSKFEIRIPLYAYWNAVSGYAEKQRGTLPDLAAHNRMAELLRGVDDQFEAALKLASQVQLERK